MPMRILTAKFAPQEPRREILTAKFGKNSHEIVRLRAQQANSQEHQNTESQNTESQERQDNQTAEVNRRLEARHRVDTDDMQRLQAQIAQRQSQNQCDNTRTEMTLRPCAKREPRSVAGESAPLDTPPLPRISDGGVEGEGSTGERTRDIRQGIGDSQLNDAGHRAITISTILAGSGVKMKAMTSTEERVGPTPQEEKDMSPEEEQQSSIADDLVRRSVTRAHPGAAWRHFDSDHRHPCVM